MLSFSRRSATLNNVKCSSESICSRGLIMILSLSISSYSCFNPFLYIVESSSKLTTGSTKSVAGKIAKNLNADIFEVVPEKPYTSEDLNWNDDNSRVSLEHSDESKREVALVKSTPEQYDTVYIGYPIWWGIAAWPVNGFVKANDFTGKTVIPFCTSASSGIGESDKQLKAMAKNGDWKDGKRFFSYVSNSDIADWLK